MEDCLTTLDCPVDRLPVQDVALHWDDSGVFYC